MYSFFKRTIARYEYLLDKSQKEKENYSESSYHLKINECSFSLNIHTFRSIIYFNR